MLRSEFFFRTTQEFIFFCRAKREFFFQDLTLGHKTKTLNQIIFFPPPKSKYFLQRNIGNQNIFLEKDHNPPPPPCKLNGRTLNVLISEKFSQYDDTFSSSLCHSHYNKCIYNSQFSALFVRKILAVMISYGF